MPIYAYRCATCGHAKDVLQKVSDPLLSTCPACGAETFTKQVTAAGFQLKGSGWYVTDFRGDNAKKKPGQPDSEPAAADKAEKSDKSDKPANTGTDSSAPAKASDSTTGKSAAAPASTPAAPAPAKSGSSAPAPSPTKKGSPPTSKG